jgi:hypothetical protein
MVIKGNLKFLKEDTKEMDFHFFLIDSSRQVVSYHWVSKFNDFEVYHETNLTSGIEKYQILISDDEDNHGEIEFYYDIQNQIDTIMIREDLKVVFDCPLRLSRKEYKKYIKKEPRLRSKFDTERHRIEIKNTEHNK